MTFDKKGSIVPYTPGFLLVALVDLFVGLEVLPHVVAPSAPGYLLGVFAWQ